MEGFGNPPLNAASETVMKRPRSVASRKPRPKEQLASEYKDLSCLPSRSISPDDEAGAEGSGHRRKELYLNVNGPEIRGSTQHRNGVSKKVSKQEKAGGDNDGGHNRSSKPKDAKHSTQGVLALACSRNPGTPDGSQLPSRDTNVPAENRIRKVKLKVSGLTRNIQTKPIQEAGDSGTPGTSDGSSHRHKHKDSGEKKHHSTSKDTHGNRTDRKRGEKHDISPSSDLVRKSKRVPKKRTLDSDDEDGELRYLKKLRVAKAAQEQPIATDSPLAYGYVEDGLRKKKLSKVSKIKSSPYEVDNDFTLSQSSRDGRKNLTLEDGDDFVVEDDSEMDEPNELKEADSPSSVKVETPGLTTRQRAGRGGHGESVIEYPDGLPAATSRKQKEKLPDVEIQARKAEVAQRRKMQVEKAEREQQAEAMRKILGIDTEKKKEERKQKEREDKEKQERFEEYKRSCIQCVMGPKGTVITFPDTMGLPSIFSSKPSSYPPPREKCAGPSCSNPYKYRDSKTKLPLCSLECYKAVQGSNQTQAC